MDMTSQEGTSTIPFLQEGGELAAARKNLTSIIDSIIELRQEQISRAVGDIFQAVNTEAPETLNIYSIEGISDPRVRDLLSLWRRSSFQVDIDPEDRLFWQLLCNVSTHLIATNEFKQNSFQFAGDNSPDPLPFQSAVIEYVADIYLAYRDNKIDHPFINAFLTNDPFFDHFQSYPFLEIENAIETPPHMLYVGGDITGSTRLCETPEGSELVDLGATSFYSATLTSLKSFRRLFHPGGDGITGVIAPCEEAEVGQRMSSAADSLQRKLGIEMRYAVIPFLDASQNGFPTYVARSNLSDQSANAMFHIIGPGITFLDHKLKHPPEGAKYRPKEALAISDEELFGTWECRWPEIPKEDAMDSVIGIMVQLNPEMDIRQTLPELVSRMKEAFKDRQSAPPFSPTLLRKLTMNPVKLYREACVRTSDADSKFKTEVNRYKYVLSALIGTALGNIAIGLNFNWENFHPKDGLYQKKVTNNTDSEKAIGMFYFKTSQVTSTELTSIDELLRDLKKRGVVKTAVYRKVSGSQIYCNIGKPDAEEQRDIDNDRSEGKIRPYGTRETTFHLIRPNGGYTPLSKYFKDVEKQPSPNDSDMIVI